MSEQLPLIVIAGPTASGKTDLAVRIAKRFDGEVVSADSMQIYKRMDIGSAKPTKEEMSGVAHHLMDFLEPSEAFSVADYVAKAHCVIADILSRGKIPIVAGGTGLYITSLVDDIDFSEEKSDAGYRQKLTNIYETEGADALLKMLLEVDSVSYETIHHNNIKRVIRALEFYHLTGYPISKQNEESKKKKSRYSPLMLMINPEREYLYERIEKRVDIMMNMGLVEEVKALSAEGLNRHNQSMQGIGYKEILDYLRGFTTLDEAVRIIKRDSRRYAKRQFTWFNRDERYIKISGDLYSRSEKEVEKYLLSQKTGKEC